MIRDSTFEKGAHTVQQACLCVYQTERLEEDNRKNSIWRRQSDRLIRPCVMFYIHHLYLVRTDQDQIKMKQGSI